MTLYPAIYCDIDKNTYEVFELENNVPTYAYELGEAINDKWLVSYHTIETKLKFVEEGNRLVKIIIEVVRF